MKKGVRSEPSAKWWKSRQSNELNSAEQVEDVPHLHPVIEHLEVNPFYPVVIGKTLNASLAAVSNTVY